MGELDFLSGYDAPQPTARPAAPIAAGPRDSGLDFLTNDFAGAKPSTPSPAGGGDDLGFSDIPGAFTAGIRRGTSDVGQTFGRSDAGETHPAARPFALSDITHPGSGLSKFAYRAASSYPTLAGGVGAGAIGTAATGNPLVGLGSGALGAAAGSALQTLGPVFQRELETNPGDPDGAWTRALKSAATSGAFSGAAWAVFPAKFFEGPLKNAAFQIFGVQPGLAVAHQATENVSHDRPALEGAPESYVEGAVGSALPIAGAKAVGKVLGKGDTAAQALAKQHGKYTAGDLENVANKHYGEIEGLKTDYTDIGELQKVQKDIRKTLINDGGNPRHDLLGKGVFETIDELTQPAEPGKAIDFGHIDNVRKMLNGYLSANEPNVRRLAREAINGLDEWIGDATKQQAAGLAPDVASQLSQKAEQARSYWHAAKGMQAWDRVQDRIDHSNNPETTRRAEIRRIVDNPKLHWQYPKEAIDLMRASLEKGFLDTVNSYTKWFSPHSATGLITDFMLHHFSGPMGLAAPVVSELLRRHVNKPLERTEEGVRHIIRHAPTGKIPQPLGVRGRTEQGFSPFVGPVTPQPQQQASGGRIKEALRLASGGKADDDDNEGIGPAALRFGDRIFTGITHGEAIGKAVKELAGGDYSKFNNFVPRMEEGFLTSKGRYVDREEAFKQLKENIGRTGNLTTEKMKARGKKEFAEGGSADMPVPRRTFRDRIYSTGAREPGKIEDRTNPYWVPPESVGDYFPPRPKQPMGSLENDIGRYDIGSAYRGFQDGGKVSRALAVARRAA